MAFTYDNPNSRGVRQDFPLRNDVSINYANVRTGFLKPTRSVITHPSKKTGMANVGVVATVEQLINGYFFPSVALTANRTLTTPSATVIVARLSVILKESKSLLAGTTFSFTIDNTQAGAFSRTLVGGTGVTIQGSGEDISQNETAEFKLTVVSGVTPLVTISRADHGISSGETLAETLVFGNTTGGTDIEITHLDKIFSSGTVNLESSAVASEAIRLQAITGDINIIGANITAFSLFGKVGMNGGAPANDAIFIAAQNPAGGIDIDSGTGGVDVDSTGQIDLTSSQAAADAIRLNASNAAGGIDIDSGTGGISVDSTGNIVISYGTTGGSELIFQRGVSFVGKFLSTGEMSVTNDLGVGGDITFFPPSGIKSGPSNGTIAGGSVTTAGTVGTITNDGGNWPAGSSRTFTVVNPTVASNSQIFIQVASANIGASDLAPFSTSVTTDVGTGFKLYVTNNDTVPFIPTVPGSPFFHYFIVNPN